MRVTQILTKTQVYEHEHPAYANAPLATYMHTYSLSLILSVCPSVRLSLTLTPVGIKGGLLQRPSHPFKPFCTYYKFRCASISCHACVLCVNIGVCVCACACVCVCLQAYTNPCTHATSTTPAPVIDTIHASAATRAQRGLKPILQQLEPPFHAPPSRPAHTRAHTHFSNRRHGTCKHRGHSTQE